jgi:hypothetical protein
MLNIDNRNLIIDIEDYDPIKSDKFLKYKLM